MVAKLAGMFLIPEFVSPGCLEGGTGFPERKMMKRLPYCEGTWFAVPLRKGGYAIGVVTRATRTGRVLLAYFFGPKHEDVPSLTDAAGIRPKDAVRRLQIGDLGLMNGKWKILGELPGWNRQSWPSPSFLRRDELSKRAWLSTYSDTDPNMLEREEPVPYETSIPEMDGLYGFGAVELLLTKLLDK